MCATATRSPGWRPRHGLRPFGACVSYIPWATGLTMPVSSSCSPKDAYLENAGLHDYTRAGLNADPPSRRGCADPRKPRPAHAAACLAAAVALGFGFAYDASAKTSRGLIWPFGYTRLWSYYNSESPPSPSAPLSLPTTTVGRSPPGARFA